MYHYFAATEIYNAIRVFIAALNMFGWLVLETSHTITLEKILVLLDLLRWQYNLI